MRDWIKSISGKTAFARLAEMRRARQKPADQIAEELIAELDTLADRSFAAVTALRSEMNQLRLATIRAKQLVIKLRKSKVDVVLE